MKSLNGQSLINDSLIETCHLPRLFRIAEIFVEEVDIECFTYKAVVISTGYKLKITWLSTSNIQSLKKGVVIEVHWITKRICHQACNIVFGVSTPTYIAVGDCVLSTVLDTWIKRPKQFSEFISLIKGLPEEHQTLIQLFFLNEHALFRFLNFPHELQGPYNEFSGLLMLTLDKINHSLISNSLINRQYGKSAAITAQIILGIYTNKKFSFDATRKCFYHCEKFQLVDPEDGCINLIFETIQKFQNQFDISTIELVVSAIRKIISNQKK